MIEEVLIQNGLTRKESLLYMAVLEAGELTLSRAAQKSGIKRSTVYGLVEDLKKRGILATLKRDSITYLSALSPKLLVEHFAHSAEMAKSILPQLLELSYASPVKPRIRFYDGEAGIKQILFEAASGGKDYIGFTDYTLMPKEVYKYIRTKVVPLRQKLNIKLRILVPRNETNIKIIKEYHHQIEHRMVNFPSRKNHIEILLFEESKTGFMSFVKNEMFGVVIDSEAIYQTLYDLFELIWNQSVVSKQ